METIVNGLIDHARLRKGRKDRKILAMREAASNAVNYGASSIEFIVLESENGDAFLLCGHNGDPFVSSEEMVSKGLAAYQSGEAGSSLNGVGLHSSALSLAGIHWDRHVKQIIMSEIDNEWHLVMGTADTATRGRLWIKKGSDHPDSVAMLDFFRGKTFNSKKNNHPFFDRNSVAYAFSLDKPTGGGINAAGDDLRIDLINTLIQSDPALFSNISVRFYDGIIKAEESYGDKQHSTSGGSSYRHAADPQEFDDRFKDDNDWDPIVIEGLEIDIDGEKVMIGKATVNIRTYSGRRDNPSWLRTVRNGNTRNGRVNNDPRGTFTAGSGSGPGKTPSKGIFLSLSAINAGEQKDCFSRFDSSAVWMDSIQAHSQDLFGMSLDNTSAYPDIENPKGIDAKPFVLVNIDIANISKIEYKDDFTEENPNAIQLLGLFREQPDFTADSGICRQIARAIMVEARKLLPKALIDLLNARCPQPEPEFIPLWGKGGGQTINRPPKHPCVVYDLSGDELSVLNPKLHLGDRKMIAIFDPKSNSFISSEVCWKHGITRGVEELSPVSNVRFLSASERDNLDALASERGVSASNIVPLLLETPSEVFKEIDGEPDRDITDNLAEEYVHGATCMPTRNLIATAPGKPTITIGHIVEIPMRPTRRGAKNDTTNNPSSQGNRPGGKGSQQNDYIRRHPKAIGQWKSAGNDVAKGGIFALNERNEQVADFFFIKNAPPSLEQRVREFYFLINAAVQSLQYTNSDISIEGSVSEEYRMDDEGEEIYGEDWIDYAANKQAEVILNSEIGQRLLDEIEKHRKTSSAATETEQAITV